jgi:multicomponent K+:H+ antiporter subunit C
VLTAIVISFGMTAVVVMMALGAYLTARDDDVTLPPEDSTEREGGA